jgi:hypothetical protein
MTGLELQERVLAEQRSGRQVAIYVPVKRVHGWMKLSVSGLVSMLGRWVNADLDVDIMVSGSSVLVRIKGEVS